MHCYISLLLKKRFLVSKKNIFKWSNEKLEEKKNTRKSNIKQCKSIKITVHFYVSNIAYYCHFTKFIWSNIKKYKVHLQTSVWIVHNIISQFLHKVAWIHQNLLNIGRKNVTSSELAYCLYSSPNNLK